MKTLVAFLLIAIGTGCGKKQEPKPSDFKRGSVEAAKSGEPTVLEFKAKPTIEEEEQFPASKPVDPDERDWVCETEDAEAGICHAPAFISYCGPDKDTALQHARSNGWHWFRVQRDHKMDQECYRSVPNTAWLLVEVAHNEKGSYEFYEEPAGHMCGEVPRAKDGIVRHYRRAQ